MVAKLWGSLAGLLYVLSAVESHIPLQSSPQTTVLVELVWMETEHSLTSRQKTHTIYRSIMLFGENEDFDSDNSASDVKIETDFHKFTDVNKHAASQYKGGVFLNFLNRLEGERQQKGGFNDLNGCYKAEGDGRVLSCSRVGKMVVAAKSVQRISRCASGSERPARSISDSSKKRRREEEEVLKEQGVLVIKNKPEKNGCSDLILRGTGLHFGSKEDQVAIQRISTLKKPMEECAVGEEHDILETFKEAVHLAAVGAALLKVAPTKGAAIQTSRQSKENIGRSLAAGSTQVALVTALVSARVRRESHTTGWFFGQPESWNSFNPAALILGDSVQNMFVGMISSTSNVFNSMTHRLGGSGITVIAEHLAKIERDHSSLSSAFGQPSTFHILEKFVSSVLREEGAPYDYIWACILLLVYTISCPRGKDLMPQSLFTDLDVYTAIAFARFAQCIMTRNLNYFRGKRRRTTRKGECPSQDPPDLCSVPGSEELLRGASDGFDSESHLKYWEVALESGSVCAMNSFVCQDLSASAMASIESLILQTKQANSPNIGSYSLLQDLSREHCKSIWMSTIPMIDPKQGVNFQSIVTSRVNMTQQQANPLKSVHSAGGTQRRWVGFKSVEIELLREFAAFYVIGAGDFAPPNRNQLSIAWSIASQTGSSLVNVPGACPGMTETVAQSHQHEFNTRSSGSERTYGTGPKETRKALEFERRLGSNYRPMPTELQKSPNSIIVTKRLMMVYDTDVKAAEALYDVVQRTTQESTTVQEDTVGFAVEEMEHQPVPAIFEPPVEPSSALTVGLLISDLLSKVLGDRTRKDRPCLFKVLDDGGSSTPARISDTTPLPIMQISHVQMEFIDGKPHDFEGEREVSIAHHMKSSNPIRLIDANTQLAADPAAGEDRFYVALLMNLGASIQASDVSDLAFHLLCGTALNSIQCSHRATISDMCALPAHLISDVYLQNYTHLKPICINTAYQGTYGPGFHHGLQSCGLAYCIHRFSDERCFGKTCIDQETINQLHHNINLVYHGENQECLKGPMDETSSEMYDSVIKDEVAPMGHMKFIHQRPQETLGIPHAMYMGLHKALDPLKESFDRLSAFTGRDGEYPGLNRALKSITDNKSASFDVNSPGRQGFVVFPYAQFTQNLAPNSSPGLHDVGSRSHTKPSRGGVNQVGRVKLHDGTPDAEAIMPDSQYFRRPTKEGVSDNPMNTPLEEVGTVLLCMSGLSETAKLACHERRARMHLAACPNLSDCGHEVASALHELLCMEHFNSSDMVPHVLACSAMIMLNTIYPKTWEVNTDVILPIYATWAKECSAAAYQQKCANKTPLGVSLRSSCKNDKEFEEASSYWRAFNDQIKLQCVWTNAVGPFIEMLVALDGCHLTSTEQFTKAKQHLENVHMYAYCVHAIRKTDGTLGRPPPECPCASAGSVSGVSRRHIDPIFIGLQDGVLPRGPLCGIKPFQYRQLLTLTIGAEFAQTVNVRRVLGHMEKSVAKAADVQTNEGEKKTYKGTNCEQVDRSTKSMGTLEQRELASVATRPAMNHNGKLLAPLFVPLSTPPNQHENTMAGSQQFVDDNCRHYDTFRKNNHDMPVQEEQLASVLMKHAFSSPENTKSYSTLSSR